MTLQGAEVSNDRNLHTRSNKRHWIWPDTATPDEQLWIGGLGEEGGSYMLVGDEAGRGVELLNPRSELHSDMERALGHRRSLIFGLGKSTWQRLRDRESRTK